MKRIFVGLLVLVLVTSLVSPTLAARGGVKGRPEVLPQDGGEGKALKKGHFKFELEGKVVGVSAPNFDVEIRSSSKSLKREGYKRGDTITIATDGSTRYRKKGKPTPPASFGDLKLNLRVHVRGRIIKNGATTFVATRVIIKPSRPE